MEHRVYGSNRVVSGVQVRDGSRSSDRFEILKCHGQVCRFGSGLAVSVLLALAVRSRNRVGAGGPV